MSIKLPNSPSTTRAWTDLQHSFYQKMYRLDATQLSVAASRFTSQNPEPFLSIDFFNQDPVEDYFVDRDFSRQIDGQNLLAVMEGVEPVTEELGLSNEKLRLYRVEARFLERVYGRKFREQERKEAKNNPYPEGSKNYLYWKNSYEASGSLPVWRECAQQVAHARRAAAGRAWHDLTEALQRDLAQRESDPQTPLEHFTYVEKYSKKLKGRMIHTAVLGTLLTALVTLISSVALSRYSENKRKRLSPS